MISNATKRAILRCIHLILSIPILGYVYSPLCRTSKLRPAVRFVFVPVLILSGFWMYSGVVFAIIGVAVWLGAYLPVWNWGGYPESGRAIHRAEDLVGDSCATFKVKFQRSGAVTDVVTTWKLALFIACLVSLSCQRQSAEKELSPFRIVATDAGFEAPAGLAAGMRHVIFENHGSEIHEAMLVKLPKGMSPEDYVAAVKKGSLFPEGALDYSGAGLTSPGKTAEMWLKVDPGQYIIICWNDSHARRRRSIRLPLKKPVWQTIDRRRKM